MVWSSSAGCGGAKAFSSELKSRTLLLREAERDEHAITFIVETFRARGGVRGLLTVRRQDGELSVREVPGGSCEEVESAMALIAALTVDPLAAGAAVRRRAAAAEATPPARAAVSERWSLRVEHRLIGQTAVAPGLAWGQAGRLVLTREYGAWRPSLGLAGHLTRATTSNPAGSAELELSAAQLSLCPGEVQPGSRWDLRLCATLQLGRLRGVGYAAASPAAQSLLWSAVGGQVEARFQVTGPLWLGCEGGVSFPLTRERFYLDPEETLHRVPAVAGGFGLGAGLRFF